MIEIEREIYRKRVDAWQSARVMGSDDLFVILYSYTFFFLFFFFFSFTSAISGHMGTPNVIGRERAERKSSAYNRLDEI